jgi:hypothetical protein
MRSNETNVDGQQGHFRNPEKGMIPVDADPKPWKRSITFRGEQYPNPRVRELCGPLQ